MTSVNWLELLECVTASCLVGFLALTCIRIICSHLQNWEEYKDKLDFPGGSDCKRSVCNVGNLGLIPQSGRSPGEGNGNPFQYSCLENSMDRGAWRATVHGVTKKSDMTKGLTCLLFSFSCIIYTTWYMPLSFKKQLPSPPSSMWNS